MFISGTTLSYQTALGYETTIVGKKGCEFLLLASKYWSWQEQQDVMGLALSWPHPGECWSLGNGKDQVKIQHCFGVGEKGEIKIF